MKFEDKYIDELVDLRNEAREQKNWKLSDEIRDYLDTKHTFIFDTNEGQVVYHGQEKTRQDKRKQQRLGELQKIAPRLWKIQRNITKNIQKLA